jgi:hypothetical protein
MTGKGSCLAAGSSEHPELTTNAAIRTYRMGEI